MFIIDSATDKLSEDLGFLIRCAGQEDASGSRRHLNTLFARRDWKGVARMLRTEVDQAETLGATLFAKYGAPAQP